MENCIFCKIVKGEIPSFKIYEDEEFIVVLDINPASKGHLLVISKNHNKIGDSLSKILRNILNLKEKLAFEDYVLIKKKDSEQFYHFVINFIPIYKGDEVLYKINNSPINPEELNKLREELKIKEKVETTIDEGDKEIIKIEDEEEIIELKNKLFFKP